ncbi:ATP-binding protein [Shewanella sp. 5_MG-2023]|uniref:hybrid sensor histidine kinase/response regulator n=1 Tax=Shewanella sp. 5_MG-2023 TaxID=3062656 RepID=UPI0026E47081|nr:ATP-binding protein [Shewanella sp. 5_MG-2023]MDO6641296.1 ATP-binding protein [Shewanella sp. 5_MG-2023]
MWFDKKNGMHLFSLFILLGAITFMASSYIFVSNQAAETAKLINEENLKGKFSAIEQYVAEFIGAHERDVNKISTYPDVISATLEGVDDKHTLHDQLSLIKPHDVDTFVNLYDFAGEGIYLEFELGEQLRHYLVERINDESILNDNNYIFFNERGQDYLLITEPIRYHALAEGLTAYIIQLNDSQLIGRLIADKNHWFGIRQDRFNWAMSPQGGWQTQAKMIPQFDIYLLYASSPQFVEKIESDFLRSLFLRMLLATSMTILLLYFLGRKILVSPFQSLARSQQLLEQQAENLKNKEAESTRLARVVKYMRDAVVFTDPDIKIIWVNGAFEKMTGYKKHEVLGMKPADLLQGPKTSKVTARKIGELIKNRGFGTFEIINYTKSNEAYWLEVQIGPLYDDSGELEGFMAVERDITERKELEDSLKLTAKKADAANISKSQFLASMSHELRTPMNGVLGMTELIKDTSLNVEQEEMVNTLLRSGKHMLSVLNDILDFSKIEAGKLTLNLTRFTINELKSEVEPIYKALCDEKGLAFSFESAGEQDKVCVADKIRIQQILQNLLNNAWKFTPQGHIAASINVINNEAEPLLEIIVSDSGIGINKDKQDYVFQAFSQAEADTTRRFGGTGLGLAIISELVNVMGGSIELNSELGVGSQFRVSIPIKLDAKPQQVTGHHSSIFDGSGLKVLIVEDNKINVKVMKMFLKKRGFDCEVAENGQIGVDKVQATHFDLVIMDNHMPVMDGIAATKAIKALNLANEPLIIGCTADAFEQTRIDMISMGCTEVVTKPIHSSKLDEILIAIF